MKRAGISIMVLFAAFVASGIPATTPPEDDAPYLVVLGIAQDGGAPQAGCRRACCVDRWDDAANRRLVSCVAIVEPSTSQAWVIDATPDFKEQLHRLDDLDAGSLAGVLLTHAHMGHYTGLMHLGHEAMGADGVPVFVMPRMREFLAGNGPWDQLVRMGNITLETLAGDHTVRLSDSITITPVLVPHRDEYSETVGYRIEGPRRSALYVPDIDKWGRWDRRIEDLVAAVDVALLDGTFYDDAEIPGRNPAEIPHPFIIESMSRFEHLPRRERDKVHFIHLNHTNPALRPASDAGRAIEAAGFHVAKEMERFEL